MCNEARCLCDILAHSKPSVTDDAVLDKERKNMQLTLKRDVLPPKQGVEAENRSDRVLTGRKKS